MTPLSFGGKKKKIFLKRWKGTVVGNADLTSAKFTQRDLWCIKGNTMDSLVSSVQFAAYPYLLFERFPMMTLTDEAGVKKT